MEIEVLVSTMNMENIDLYADMNLQTNAVIINQHNNTKREVFEIDGSQVLVCTYKQLGIGRSRNCAILNSSADICVFADDDMVFCDGYAEIIKNEFERNPNADGILFNIDVKNADRPVEKIKNDRKMSLRDAMRYGIPAFAVKRDKLLKKNIWFSLLFGGGAKYGSGEDTIFFKDMIKNKMNIYISTKKIADTDAGNSSWFNGFNEKYFTDKGALYAAMFGRKAKLSVIISAYRWCRKLNGEYRFKDILKYMYNGIDEFLS